MLLITGANGQLGQEFQALQGQFPNLSFRFLDKAELDITDARAIEAYFSDHDIQYCINCAAYTAVDKAESEPEQARLINVEGPRLLARACAERDTRLIHFSTDYVYDGRHNRPFSEDHPTQPQSVYARTKLEGEQAAQAELPSTTIIRTSWVYSSFGHNFVKTMLRLGRERDELRVVFDQIGTPTYARHLAHAVLQMIGQHQEEGTDLSGIFHYSNEGVCSWYDFALSIFELKGIACRVQPIESKDYPTPAARPHFSLLNKQKVKEQFGLQIPHWREGLKTCLSTIEEGR